MLTIDPRRSCLLLIDFQPKLMPVIHEGEIAVRNAGRLLAAARMLEIPRLFTEQNTKRLGASVAELPVQADRVIHKQTFDACQGTDLLAQVPVQGHVLVTGCEAHVCVLQTALGLRAASRKTYVVRDAIGSRYTADKEAALRRLEGHGVEVVTTEMVLFEWLRTAEHPHFRSMLALIK